MSLGLRSGKGSRNNIAIVNRAAVGTIAGLHENKHTAP